MRLADETLTVFNKREADGDVTYRPTVIRGASLHRMDASAVDTAKGGLIAANKVIVRIPAEADAGGSVYAPPLAYARSEDPEGHWTLGSGTVIVRGEVSGEGWTPAALAAAFDDCTTVLTVTDNRRAPNAPHFKAVGS